MAVTGRRETGTMKELRRSLYEVASKQYGLVTRADLQALDVSPARRRTLLNDSTLMPVGQKVFRIGGSPATPKQAVLAGCLETGGSASGRTSAWLHKIGRGGPGPVPQVLVARERYNYRTPLAEVHTTTWLPSHDTVVVDGIPCLGVARTLFALAAAARDNDLDCVRDAVDEAVRDGKASDAWLWWRLERLRRRGRPGVSRFEAILGMRAGAGRTESWLEREFLRLLMEAGLPLPTCQERISRDGAFVARVDFLYRDRRIVIEVSGHATHSTRAQQMADAARRTELALAGFMVLEFTYDEVVRSPDFVLARIVRALTNVVAA